MDASKDSRTVAKEVLYAQAAWAVLAAAWNFAGAALIASGQRAPGPTASVGSGVALLAVAIAFVVAVSRWPRFYVVLSAVAALMAAVAVFNAFVQDPALWPSEFWRYAGIVLNGGGAIASVLALLATVKWRA